MANLKIVRIDYRLIHGQVVAKWIKFRPINRIIIADDELLQDEFMSDIYKMAAPENEVEIVAVDHLEEALNRKNDNVMVIFKNVNSAYRAFTTGVLLQELNVGASENKKDRKLITQGVALSKEEYKLLEDLKDKGVNVYIQPIPENDKINLESVKNKMR